MSVVSVPIPTLLVVPIGEQNIIVATFDNTDHNLHLLTFNPFSLLGQQVYSNYP